MTKKELIKKTFEESGIPLHVVSENSGISESDIQKTILGAKPPKADTIDALIAYFDLSDEVIASREEHDDKKAQDEKEYWDKVVEYGLEDHPSPKRACHVWLRKYVADGKEKQMHVFWRKMDGLSQEHLFTGEITYIGEVDLDFPVVYPITTYKGEILTQID